ncbi:FecR family protein [Mucilaginibacter pineti]|uniref:FecR family protein n=1 Tax=Mucilaginibacter pineti TaxID=1391627 RepID=A0A1G7M1K6_9SPHI|nr:FecR domain-containing protein [Mucilaginibacter pineti]SDF55708.1 FecR family protein [Mucilaginibacter pineti]
MDLENRNKHLIRKYINKNCTPQEMEELQKLMSLPEVQHLFEEVLSETWTSLEPENDIDQPHLDLQLNKFYNKLNNQEIDSQRQGKSAFIRVLYQRRYLSYAAIWAVFVIGFFTYRFWSSSKPVAEPRVAMREMVNPYGRRSKIILPDSSEVFLGAGSKLTVPEVFTGNLREISLQGEAFFQVTKNPKKPFIIHTGTVQTKVLGTSFKIEAFKGQPLVVAVVTGKVRVDNYTGKSHSSLAVLTPGQKVTYNHGQAFAGKAVIDDVRSWKDGRQVFNDQTLKNITDVLERWYNVHVQYQNSKKSGERISVILQADRPFNNIMNVLSATGHFKYAVKGNTVIIN